MARITRSQLVRLQKKLKTDAAIGKEFGITRQAVHQIRKKYGISSNLINNPDRNDEIYNSYKEGLPVAKIMKKFKLSPSQTYRIINIHKAEEEKAKRVRKAKKSDKMKIAKKKADKKIVIKAVSKKVQEKKSKKKSDKPSRKKTTVQAITSAP